MSANSYWYDGDEVIDLTDSFTYVDHGHDALRNTAAIELEGSDDPYIEVCINNIHSGNVPNKRKRAKGKKSASTKKENKDLLPPKRVKKIETSEGFGECPICCEKLGDNPIVSTKCGHVFCHECLKRSIRIQKKCPTCRKHLRGSTAYHPLYL